jgi:hypothetical protein
LKFAEKFCHKHGGELAELNIKNFDCISTAVRKEGIKTPVWIESWNGDNYRHAGIALFPAIPEGAIAIPRSKKNPGLCELKKRH